MEQQWEVVEGKKDISTVLVIEDRPDVIKVVDAILWFTDYKWIFANTWEQGLDIYKNIKPDLVLLDLTLPDMLWEDVLRQLFTINKDVKVIIGTWERLDEKQKQWLSWAKWFLYKPYDFWVFTSTIKEVIATKN